MNKKGIFCSNIIDFIMTLISIFLLILIIAFGIYHYNLNKEIKKDYECYINHVQGCLYCHSMNMTYLLCPGFCVKPFLEPESCPFVSPNKDCFDLPRECNL